MPGRSDEARAALDEAQLAFLREHAIDPIVRALLDRLDAAESALASARAAGAAEAFERAAKRVSAHLDCEEAGGRCARGILDVLEQDAAAPVRP